MRSMRFLKLSLLSPNERRALQLDLSPPRVVLLAGNGFGKSAVLKCLYETLGAPAHKVDQSWKDAKVISLLEFSVDGRSFAALKSGKNYTIFDADKKVLLNTDKVVSDLAPFLADLLDFRLVLTDRANHVRTPPPSYAFAPFYIDQDGGWRDAWSGFTGMNMFAWSAKILAEYHSGLRPNGYYAAKSKRDQFKIELAAIDAERRAVAQALRKVSEGIPDLVLELGLEDFKQETDALIVEAQTLHEQEIEHRQTLIAAHEELHVWSNQVVMIEAAIAEQDESFNAMLKAPHDIECPMCGQHYANQISEQFALVADKGDLLVALQTARGNRTAASEKCEMRQKEVRNIEESIGRIDALLAVRKETLTLRDVIAAEGRTEARRYLKERVAELDHEYGEKERVVEECSKQMAAFDDRRRKAEIMAFFSERFVSGSKQIDVRLSDKEAKSLQGAQIGRGSEGPRAIAAHFYAFLHTVRKYGSSAFCPIVVDAPNQQGQDGGHLDQIMKFLLSEPPADSQVIIGTESLSLSAQTDVEVIQLTAGKNQLLRDDNYGPVTGYMNTYLAQSLL